MIVTVVVVIAILIVDVLLRLFLDGIRRLGDIGFFHQEIEDLGLSQLGTKQQDLLVLFHLGPHAVDVLTALGRELRLPPGVTDTDTDVAAVRRSGI
ncbi:MAG: hypothetical protein ACPG77_03785, partial [Nannocystaceae bacterium]